jgi:hypothetical protein
MIVMTANNAPKGLPSHRHLLGQWDQKLSAGVYTFE